MCRGRALDPKAEKFLPNCVFSQKPVDSSAFSLVSLEPAVKVPFFRETQELSLYLLL